MHYIVICGLPRSTTFFPHCVINGTIFGKQLLNIKCVFFSIFFKTFVCNISQSKKIAQDMIKMYIGLHVMYPLFLSDLNETLIFRKISKKKKILKYQISWKSAWWEPSCSMWNSANAPKYGISRHSNIHFFVVIINSSSVRYPFTADNAQNRQHLQDFVLRF